MNIQKNITIAIVPDECTESVISSISKSGASNIISIPARGTAEKALLQSLGLGQTKKNLIAFRQTAEISFSVCKLCNDAMSGHKEKNGIVFTVIMRKKNMDKKVENLVICVIVNAGYAEAVMQEARKAGARGGTIINARGTGKEQDMDFFGIQIVPEKEMLVMVAETELANKLVDVVKSLPLLEKPGSGLVFTLEVENCKRLGGNSNDD